MILKPVRFASKFPPIVKAINDEDDRVKKYFPPRSKRQFDDSSSCVKPLRTSCCFDSRTTWNGDTPQFAKARNSDDRERETYNKSVGFSSDI